MGKIYFVDYLYYEDAYQQRYTYVKTNKMLVSTSLHLASRLSLIIGFILLITWPGAIYGVRPSSNDTVQNDSLMLQPICIIFNYIPETAHVFLLLLISPFSEYYCMRTCI